MQKAKVLSLLLAIALLLGACATPAAQPPAEAPTPEPAGQPAADPAEEPPANADTTVDFVVAGAGMGGVAAATEAAKQGKSVILLEKLSFAGGSSAMCEGFLWASDSKMNEECGIGYSAAQMAAYFQESGGDVVNAALIENMVNISGEIFDQINAEGVPFHKDRFTGSGGTATDLEVFIAEGDGPGMMQNMIARAVAAGVEIRYESPAVSLIVENGEVKGINVENAAGNYAIYAGTTILATGGFLMNEEMMEEYLPNWAGMNPLCSVGNTGDGHRMAMELGAQMIGDNITGTWGWDGQNGYKMEGGMAPALGLFLVNKEGKRFTSEIDPLKNANVVAQPERKAYCFFDSKSNYIDLLEGSVAAGLTEKADSLEALAELVGIDPAALLETVGAYNDVAAAGGVDEFGMPGAYMTPLTEGPFYMTILSPEIHNATLMGLKVNEYAQILDANEQPIPNLYGVGELILGGIVNDRYPTCGSCLGAGIYCGVVAVRHAAGV